MVVVIPPELRPDPLRSLALLSGFDPMEVFGPGGEARLAALSPLCEEHEEAGRWLWALTPAARRAALALLPPPGRERQAWLAALPERPQDALARAFRRLLAQGPKDLRGLIGRKGAQPGKDVAAAARHLAGPMLRATLSLARPGAGGGAPDRPAPRTGPRRKLIAPELAPIDVVAAFAAGAVAHAAAQAGEALRGTLDDIAGGQETDPPDPLRHPVHIGALAALAAAPGTAPQDTAAAGAIRDWLSDPERADALTLRLASPAPGTGMARAALRLALALLGLARDDLAPARAGLAPGDTAATLADLRLRVAEGMDPILLPLRLLPVFAPELAAGLAQDGEAAWLVPAGNPPDLSLPGDESLAALAARAAAAEGARVRLRPGAAPAHLREGLRPELYAPLERLVRRGGMRGACARRSPRATPAGRANWRPMPPRWGTKARSPPPSSRWRIAAGGSRR